MSYKYHLLKYAGPSTRWTCPNCGRKHCFTPFVDSDNRPVGREFGRCDHESSCGYIKYPEMLNEYNFVPKRPVVRKRQETDVSASHCVPSHSICSIPHNIVERTVVLDRRSDFIKFLIKVYGEEAVMKVIELYRIGTTRGEDVIFYQIDMEGRCRTGKIMSYDPETGHRIKGDSTAITWVHSLMKQRGLLPPGWELKQCLFGEHILKQHPEKQIIIVESEKTAVICAIEMPEYIWLATGGKGQLNDRIMVLRGRKIIAIPDTDAYGDWCRKVKSFPEVIIEVSDILEGRLSEEDKRKGLDLADILIQWRKANKSLVARNLDRQNPIRAYIQKYISIEEIDEVCALIGDLDLEFISNPIKIPGSLKDSHA